MHGSIFNLSSF